ncbi:MAG: oxygen-independent coproporphyrinogen III oxidase [Enterobacteriaceae bacterium]
MPIHSIQWDHQLIRKYDASGPRYTSYPTAVEFNEQFDEQAFRQAANQYPDRPLSLYIHIPFCHKLCYFCGCNKIITRHAHKADRYLDILEKEIQQRGALFRQREVSQLHLGGGTPTFLSKAQFTRLMSVLRDNFTFQTDAEIALESDPREIELDMIDHLRSLGFNRLSMGIQDFNPEVQQRINRVQDQAVIFALVERARKLGFTSISIDLIYGLPLQTLESFRDTLQKVIRLNPDRMSVFNYAHLPERFAAQRKIRDHELPSPQQKLMILQETITLLTEAGYQFIGMDHFAKPDDEMALAQREGQLHRNFQGYTTHGNCDLLGMGVSAISMMGDSYSQNQKELKAYYQQTESQGHALCKGFSLSQDDCLRRDVIKQLLCHFHLDMAAIERQYAIDFRDYFTTDLQLLQPMVEDQLLTLDDQQIQVTPKGRLLIRNICMCFDIYLRQHVRRQFSRVI